ncbi:MAG: hypothetical protein J0M08_03885 [Bacteroidetes bacterium]|nr:hypothetical protein [Bacteroidota bacterium]
MNRNKIKFSLILLCLVFFTLTNFALTGNIRLTYKPKGIIVLFYFDSLKVYSDTTSILNLISKMEKNNYLNRSRNLILKSIQQTNNDTISFYGHSFPFHDKVDSIEWNISNLIIQLTDRGNVVIFDKENQIVKKIKTKKITETSKHRTIIDKVYINKTDNTVLFKKNLMLATRCGNSF